MDNMDSIEVRIPDEIRVYKEKYGGFTFRQWIGVVLVACIAVPTYYFLLKNTVQTFAMMVTTLLAAPIGLIFFIPINGMPAEKMLPYFKRIFVDFGRILKFQTNSEMEVEKELMNDKKYRKQMKKLKKMEKKNQKRIERGSAVEENAKLQAYRADVDAYYNALRQEKIHALVSSKVDDISLGINRKEQKRLHKETVMMNRSKTQAYLTEDELGYSRDNGTQVGLYGNSYQANSMTSSLDGKKSFGMLDSGKGLANSSTSKLVQNVVNADRSSTDFDDNQIVSKPYVEQGHVQESTVSIDDVEQGLSEFGKSQETVVARKPFSNENETDKELSPYQDGVEVVENVQPHNSNETEGNPGISKRQKVLQFYRSHPGASMADCKAVTGVEMRTIRRCWPKG